MSNFNHADRRKAGLFLLAAVCAFIAGAGLRLLLLGETRVEVLYGGGRLLFWGAIMTALLARVHGRRLPGISAAVWTGAGMMVVTWL